MISRDTLSAFSFCDQEFFMITKIYLLLRLASPFNTCKIESHCGWLACNLRSSSLTLPGVEIPGMDYHPLCIKCDRN